MRSPDATLSRTSYALLCALLALALGACDGGGSEYRSPVAPEVPVAPPAPLPPGANLTGSWTGTTTVTWDEMDGGGSCAEPVTATFAQDGAAVSGTLTDSSECGGSREYRFEGTLEGTSLRGDIVFPDFSWPAFGEVSGGRLAVSAVNMRWELSR